MFPSPSKEGRPAQIVAISPKHVRENNRSTYLPYFKRFPNHKFHSQERSRPSQDPVKNERARRFFTEEHESNAPSDSAFAKAFSSATIKQKSSS